MELFSGKEGLIGLIKFKSEGVAGEEKRHYLSFDCAEYCTVIDVRSTSSNRTRKQAFVHYRSAAGGLRRA